MVRFGSVCSGIEAASVAWEPLGWEAQWVSEIEHFPSAVLAHRFPSVPNLGDMTKIHEQKQFQDATIDLLVGGTPCQSFSVAGLRKGLDDSRGGLMLTFVELAARKRPKWLVWENVPGVLSSNKGKDFATFLGLLTGREVQPPVGGWKNSGCIGGIGAAYGVAWRVLDAQHFGVAQRRRRVFVVGYLGDWRPSAAVLFEQDCLSGNTKKSREKRKATSADAEGGSGGRGEQIATFAGNIESDTAATLQTTCDDYSRADGFNVPVHTYSIPAIGNIKEDNVSSCITKNTGGGGETQNPAYVAHAFKVSGGSEVETGEQGGTPGKKAGKGYLGSDELAFTIGTTQDQQIAQYPIAFNERQQAQTATENCANTLSATDYKGVQCVAQPIAVHKVSPTITARIQGSSGWAPYNETEHLIQVAFRKARRAQSKDDHETWEQDEKTNTLNAFDVGDIRTTQAVVQPIAVDTYNQTINEHTTQTIGSSATDVNHYGAVLTPQAVDFRNQNLSEDVTGTLQSKSNGGYSLNYQPGILQPTMAIRRLTPTECERLQGFPDGWTKIPYRNKPAEDCPDGPRYKACGNSMAVPVMHWIGKRIQMVIDLLK